MIEIQYQYPGDPLFAARLLFGAEFKLERGPGYINVHAVNEKGEVTSIESVTFDEAICDSCSQEVEDIDPCVITGGKLYCWPCAKEWVLRHRVARRVWVK